jgi:hypothetical protein
MSYTLTLVCGCTVYVSCDPQTRVAHNRIIERRGPVCRNRRHDLGARVWLWEMLPDHRHDGLVEFNDDAVTPPVRRLPQALRRGHTNVT